MSWIKASFIFMVMVSVLLLGVVLAVSNPHLVILDLVWWKFEQVPFGMLLVACVFIGAVIGVMVNGFMLFKLRNEKKKLQKQLLNAQKRFEQLQ